MVFSHRRKWRDRVSERAFVGTQFESLSQPVEDSRSAGITVCAVATQLGRSMYMSVRFLLCGRQLCRCTARSSPRVAVEVWLQKRGPRS